MLRECAGFLACVTAFLVVAVLVVWDMACNGDPE